MSIKVDAVRKQDKARAAAAAKYSALVTHTTAIIAGPQHAHIAVHGARTDEASLIVTLGHLMMTFRDAETVHEVISGFASARAQLMGIDNHAPRPDQPGAEFALNALGIVWFNPPEHAVVTGSRWDDTQRRTLHWVDLHMGPITWRIADRDGYNTLLTELRNVHRTAVAVFLDGGKFRKDPTVIDND